MPSTLLSHRSPRADRNGEDDSLHYKWATCNPNEAIEAQIEAICCDAASAIPQIVGELSLHGIVLGGGYGRGEGGVLTTELGDRLYNDVEFYVFVKGSLILARKKWGHALHLLAENLTTKHAIDVEFHLISLDKLHGSPPSMFFYDLVLGHRVVWGPHNLLKGCPQHTNPALIPLHEATRLLMNRGSGLLFAKAKLRQPLFSQEDADFVWRNLAKARLAMGDALLTQHGRYHWSCRQREKLLRDWTLDAPLPRLVEIQSQHIEGVHFKLAPIRCQASRGDLEKTWQEVTGLFQEVWLMVERSRLKKSFDEIWDYAYDRGDKCPEVAQWRSVAVRLKVFKKRALTHWKFIHRHPRHHVLSALPVLLWHSDPFLEARAGQHLAKHLAFHPDNFQDAVAAYRRLWEQVN